MVPFLNLFGVKEGNGIYTFAVKIENPWYLVCLVNQLFRPPGRDPRGPNNRASTSNLGDNEVDDVDMEAPDGALVSGDEEDSPSLALLIPLELSPDVIAARM